MGRVEKNLIKLKSGTREDLGFYVRSSWEANYARYLNFLKENKLIKDFEYESKTFVFEKISRGNRHYTPDFTITNLDGTIEHHEVKGWMDDKSRVKLSRMARYFPEEKIVLIDKKFYFSLKKKVSNLIPNWEG